MAITGILVAIAIPSFSLYIEASQISGATNALMGGFQRARSEAISQRAIVGICRSANPNAEPPACSNTDSGAYNSRDWTVGYIVYRKADANTNRDYETGDQVLYRQPAFATGSGYRAVAVSENFTTIDYGLDGLWVDPQGGVSPAAFNVYIDYRGAASATAYAAGGAFASNRARCVAVSFLGRADLKRTCT